MVDLFYFLTSEKKNRSSNSSTNESPDPKKIRSSQNFSSDTEQLHKEYEDEVLKALHMAENVQEKLQPILQKLEKLDVFEQSVNNLQAKTKTSVRGNSNTGKFPNASHKRHC